MGDPVIEAKQSKIVEACKKRYESNKEQCNYFFQEVFKDVTDITLTGTADSLVQTFSTDKNWEKVDRKRAIEDVNKGKFVIAALKSGDHAKIGTIHGHIVVVVSGELYRHKYPLVWCGGGTLGRSDGTKSVGEVWTASDRDKVLYFSYKNY